MLSKISVMDSKKIETLFGLTEETTALTFNELVDTASTV
jgi:hypothetical protein